jgi:hypothetical protein
MKLSLHLGLAEPRRTVYWWSPIANFPTFILYKGNKFELVGYQKDNFDQIDYNCYFIEVHKADPNYRKDYMNIDYLLNKDNDLNKCDCGAEFSSFPWDHMRFCQSWKPW